MMTPQELNKWLEEQPIVLLDGALGTELERRGYQTRLPLWSASANIEAPQLVHEVHTEYIAAGAHIITANTFRTTAHTFDKVNRPELGPHCTRLAVELAREAITQSGRDVLLAGSIAPLEDCYSPDLVPDEKTVEQGYSDILQSLTSTSIDLILVETMINRSEATILAQLLSETEISWMMSFTADQDGQLLDGTPLAQVVDDISQYGPTALLLNCRDTQTITSTLKSLTPIWNGHVGVYANGGGHPDPDIGWKLAPNTTDTYIAAARQWQDHGVKMIGGCCGTTPSMIASLSEALIQHR